MTHKCRVVVVLLTGGRVVVLLTGGSGSATKRTYAALSRRARQKSATPLFSEWVAKEEDIQIETRKEKKKKERSYTDRTKMNTGQLAGKKLPNIERRT